MVKTCTACGVKLHSQNRGKRCGKCSGKPVYTKIKKIKKSYIENEGKMYAEYLKEKGIKINKSY